MKSSIDELSEKYPEIPRSIIIKANVLRSGVRCAPDLGIGFHHHHHIGGDDESGSAPRTQKDKCPSKSHGNGGKYHQRHFQGSFYLGDGTTVYLTHSENSPYQIARHPTEPEKFALCENDEIVEEIFFPPVYEWTAKTTRDGTPMANIFSPGQGGRCGAVAVFVLRYCEYAKSEERCRFCGCEQMIEPEQVRPNVANIIEAFTAISEEQDEIGYLALSGGSLINRKKEANAYIKYMHAFHSANLDIPCTCVASQAMQEDDIRRLKDVGYDVAAFNMELWAEDLWPVIVPGKSKYVGRENWMKSLVKAVEIFGEGNVLTNFVAGIEMTRPHGFETVDQAVKSTAEGFEWCLNNGIYPRYAFWNVKWSAAYAAHEPPPIDYYLKLGLEADKLLRKHDPPIPPTDCYRCLTQSFDGDFPRL